MWASKRLEIITRDNFTCQECKKFNPSLGEVVIIDDDTGHMEIHRYEQNSYLFYSSLFERSINFEFGCDTYLVCPILQVHHLKYINQRAIWEYDNADLLTLCKECHRKWHKSKEIPVYDADMNRIENRIFNPIDNGIGRRHKYKPWVCVSYDNNNEEYKLANIDPLITILVLDAENGDIVEAESKKMLDYFIRKYLPDYSRK